MPNIQDRLSELRRQAMQRSAKQEVTGKPVVDELARGIKVDISTKNVYYLNKSYDFNIKLPKTEPIFIGLDQSTAQTGIAILRADESIICLIDYRNYSNIPARNYTIYLRRFLKKLLKGTIVGLVVLEQPWGGWSHANAALKPLLRELTDLFQTLPETKVAPLKFIYPNQWRSAFLTSKSYKGRFKGAEVKQAVREEVLIRYPQLESFAYHNNINKPLDKRQVPDSFEALGALVGYIAKNYSNTGLQKITKNIKYTARNVSWQVIPFKLDEFKSNFKETNDIEPSYKDIELAVLEKTYDGVYTLAMRRGSRTMLYNRELTLEMNAQLSGCETSEIVVSLINSRAIYCQQVWRLGRPLGKGEYFFLVSFRK